MRIFLLFLLFLASIPHVSAYSLVREKTWGYNLEYFYVPVGGEYRVIASASNTGTNLKSLITQVQWEAGINGAYFIPRDYTGKPDETNTLRIVAWDSKTYSKFAPDTGVNVIFGFLADGSPLLVQNNIWQDARLKQNYNSGSLSSLQYGIANFPLLLKDGKWMLDLYKDTGLISDKMKAKSSKTFICKTENGSIKMGFISSITIYEVPSLLKKIWCIDAINLDNGGSTAMYQKWKYIKWPWRNIMDGLVIVKKTVVPPSVNATKALQTSKTQNIKTTKTTKNTGTVSWEASFSTQNKSIPTLAEWEFWDGYRVISCRDIGWAKYYESIIYEGGATSFPMKKYKEFCRVETRIIWYNRHSGKPYYWPYFPHLDYPKIPEKSQSTATNSSISTTNTSIQRWALTVSLAGQATAQYVPKNTSAIKVGTIRITAQNADISISEIVVSRSGLGAFSAIASITTNLGGTSTLSPQSQSISVRFQSPITISKGTSRDIDMLVSLAGDSNEQHQFTLTSVTATNATVTGTPITLGLLNTTSYR